MKRLTFLDKAFLLAESRETPMHVGGINLFTMPEKADPRTFMHELSEGLKATNSLQPVFGDKLRSGPLGMMGPMHFVQDKEIDLSYHIRHSALPKPGRYRELFELVSRLHATRLDRNRPLWEMHLIEGLKNRQFAVYTKYHHAVIDGTRSMHLTQSMFSNSARSRMRESPLSTESMERYRAMLEAASIRPTDEEIRNVADRLKAAYDSNVNLVGALRRFSEAWMGRGGALSLPWLEVPRTSINTPVDGARRFVAQSWDFQRIRAVGKGLDGTFNDVVLAMCGGALRSYLKRQQGLPPQSLKAMVPVSLRKEGDIDSPNAVGTITADLGTNIKDPVKRFALIKDSMRAGKEIFQGMSQKECELFMQVTQLPGLMLIPLGLISRFPPFNTVISNVPGPRRPMYWNGARMEGIYPASIVAEGIAVNITLVSYNKNVDFGIIACRRTMTSAQQLIDDLEDALQSLEEAAGLRGRQRGKRA